MQQQLCSSRVPTHWPSTPTPPPPTTWLPAFLSSFSRSKNQHFFSELMPRTTPPCQAAQRAVGAGVPLPPDPPCLLPALCLSGGCMPAAGTPRGARRASSGPGGGVGRRGSQSPSATRGGGRCPGWGRAFRRVAPCEPQEGDAPEHPGAWGVQPGPPHHLEGVAPGAPAHQGALCTGESWDHDGERDP